MKPFLYEQLIGALLGELASGFFSEKARFLSNRKICKLWQVSEPTAKTALGWLCDRNLIAAYPRSGYRVNEGAQQKAQLMLHKLNPAVLEKNDVWAQKKQIYGLGTVRQRKRVGVILSDHQDHPIAVQKIDEVALGSYAVSLATRSIFRYAVQQNLAVQFYVDDGQLERRQRILDLIEHDKIDGVIAFRRTPTYTPLQDLIKPLAKRRLSIVSLFDDCEHFNIASINLNNIAIGYEGVQRLLKLGHRRIGMVVPNRFDYFEDRVKGAQMAIQQCEDEVDFSVLEVRGRLSNDLENKNLRHLPYTALFVTTFNCMSFVLKWVRSHRLTIPRDISLLAVGSSQDCSELKLAFDLMKIDFDAIGSQAIKVLHGLMQGDPYHQRSTLVGIDYCKGETLTVPLANK